jgi:hypothetical protein
MTNKPDQNAGARFIAPNDSESSEIASTMEEATNQDISYTTPDEHTPSNQDTTNTSTTTADTGFRPLTRTERRNLWLKEYGEQDFALQMWVRLVEQQDLEIEMMFQMHGMLIFGVMVSTFRYAQFYIDLNEELHRQREPETADALHEYYSALVPPHDQPEIGPEGLPVVSRFVHMRDVTIMSAGHKVKVPYWRGKISAIDAFVVGATAGE